MSTKYSCRNAVAVIAIAGLACMDGRTSADETIRTADGLLSLTASMPEEIRAGEEFTYDVVASKSDNITLHDIELKQLNAAGFSVTSTSIKSSAAEQSAGKQSASKQSESEKHLGKGWPRSRVTRRSNSKSMAWLPATPASSLPVSLLASQVNTLAAQSHRPNPVN